MPLIKSAVRFLMSVAFGTLVAIGPSFPARTAMAADQVDAIAWLITGLSYATFGPTTTTVEAFQAPGNHEAAKQQEMFVEANYDKLTVELAQGSGDTVTAYFELLGCKDLSSDDVRDMREYLQRIAGDFIPKEKDPSKLAVNLRKSIRARISKFREGCKWIDRAPEGAIFIK